MSPHKLANLECYNTLREEILDVPALGHVDDVRLLGGEHLDDVQAGQPEYVVHPPAPRTPAEHLSKLHKCTRNQWTQDPLKQLFWTKS